MASFAIIGYGKMGKIYDSLLEAKYLVDSRPVSGRVYFQTTEELITYHQRVDLVIVTTPSNTHYEIAKKLLVNSHNVLVEKPICLSSQEARELEMLAQKSNLILHQSTLERYNPLVKFFQKNIPISQIRKIESFRFGPKPKRAYVEEARFDLGIHDVDLWFYLAKKSVPWRINVEYSRAPRREMAVYFKDGRVLKLDLLNKNIWFNSHNFYLEQTSFGNPILEMVWGLLYNGNKMNEKWSEEIAVIERAKGNVIKLP